MAEVRLDGLTKVYPSGTVALRNLNLIIHDGELIVLMGPSGCGKTTTLRLIAGLEQPTAGNVWIGKDLVTHWPPHRRDVAMVFQRPALYPHLSVAKNLSFGACLKSACNGQRIGQVANRLQLADVLDRKPWQLSGGQQQRVALGRAIMRQPKVFLLDEPLSNLDARLRSDLRRELHLLHRQLRTTMIYVTHDQMEAMTLGERVAVMNAGVVQQMDTPAGLYDRPANRFVAAAVGATGMNLLNGQLSADGASWRFGCDDCELPLPEAIARRWLAFRARPLTIGIRPENVRVGITAETNGLAMPVVLQEETGDHCLTTLQRGDWSLTAQTDGRTNAVCHAQLGQLMQVQLDMSKAHLFDGVSGVALSHPETG